jgi:hypothetical protein
MGCSLVGQCVAKTGKGKENDKEKGGRPEWGTARQCLLDYDAALVEQFTRPH